MAKGYGVEVGDVALIALMGLSAYMLWKMFGKTIADTGAVAVDIAQDVEKPINSLGTALASDITLLDIPAQIPHISNTLTTAEKNFTEYPLWQQILFPIPSAFQALGDPNKWWS